MTVPVDISAVFIFIADLAHYKLLWLDRYHASEAFKRDAAIEHENTADKAVFDVVLEAATIYSETTRDAGRNLDLQENIRKSRLESGVRNFINDKHTVHVLRRAVRKELALQDYEAFESRALCYTIFAIVVTIMLPTAASWLLGIFHMPAGNLFTFIRVATVALPFVGHVPLWRRAARLKRVITMSLDPHAEIPR